MTPAATAGKLHPAHGTRRTYVLRSYGSLRANGRRRPSNLHEPKTRNQTSVKHLASFFATPDSRQTPKHLTLPVEAPGTFYRVKRYFLHHRRMTLGAHCIDANQPKWEDLSVGGSPQDLFASLSSKATAQPSNHRGDEPPQEPGRAGTTGQPMNQPETKRSTSVPAAPYQFRLIHLLWSMPAVGIIAIVVAPYIRDLPTRKLIEVAIWFCAGVVAITLPTLGILLHRGAITRRAGPLLLAAGPTHPLRCKPISLRSMLFYLTWQFTGAALLFNFLVVSPILLAPTRPVGTWFGWFTVIQAVVLPATFFPAFLRFHWVFGNRALELRRHGIIFAGATFVPWSKITRFVVDRRKNTLLLYTTTPSQQTGRFNPELAQQLESLLEERKSDRD